MGEKTDPKKLIRDLNVALPLQYRSVLALSTAAGTIPGPAGIALAPELRRFAEHTLGDVERLAGRIASLGGIPSRDVAPLTFSADWAEGLRSLIAQEYEAINALARPSPPRRMTPRERPPSTFSSTW